MTMQKNRIPVYLLLLTALVTFTLAGCKGDKAPQGNEPTGFELAMTDHDTTTVVNLVNQFFESVESGNVTDAVAMLYHDCDSDVYAEPQLLDNEQIQRITAMLKALPIVAHRIEYIKFSETYSNEVKVSAIMAEAKDGMPEVKTVFYFKPVDYMSSWRLCLVESSSGDRRVISNEQADSLQEKFANDMKAKQQKE